MEKTSKKNVKEKKKGDKKDISSKKKPKKVNSKEKTIKSSKDNDKKNEKIHKNDSFKKNKVIEKNKNDTINVNNGRGKACFLCFCCGGNEEEKLNELIMEEERRKEEERKKIEKEDKKKREDEEKEREKERERERERLRLIEEQEKDRLILLEEKEKLRLLEEEKQKQLEEEEKQKKKDTILKKKEVKPKLFTKKRAKLNFIGAAAAPNPPPESACIGEPPQVKETSISVQEGIYLIYNHENDGQLELHYSRTGKKGKGVLAYIHSKTIPDFYFEKNMGKEVIFTEVSKKMQSVYVNDLKPYYECYIEFIKMKKIFNGILYFLPAFDEQPPPKLDIVFFNSKAKQLNFVPVEKPVEFTGDYLFVIQKGLEIFKKEINMESLFSYINSYGALLSLS
ncbi:conserved Plasmodium protein, unknown function [Plasmodium gallinaceum]|uniref:Immune mapped protein 2 N-terminal domain-containing protein n=1 Tax=Plasmodium gallinaceum TaxID=5849 RepID=A0A1J1GP92_PLAGA|nr:conserved Plasmodium protein, unknown function [Plasmodium gallinaceum]CRG94118.1 conserved Plasmodium protein, unknown function [Plasmodium gallinaceum]